MSIKNRPTEILEIKNFLSIKEAKIEIKPITLLIGENATGKSVISKLVYLVREGLLNEALRRVILFSSFVKGRALKEDIFRYHLRKNFTIFFQETFPFQYLDNFKISYRLDNTNVVSITKSKKGLNINFEKKFRDNLFRAVLEYIENEIIPFSEETPRRLSPAFVFRIVDNVHKNLFKIEKSIRNVFIPHARTMYLYMGALDIEKRLEHFDYPMTKFLNAIEILPAVIAKKIFLVEQGILNEYLKYENKTLHGKLVTKEEKVFIELNNKVFDIYHMSSGQQELIPLILLLRYALTGHKDRIFRFSIEEPETHLFPTTQRDLTYLFGYMYNLNTEFLITTHSPYILSAFNNLLFAKKLYKETAKKEIKEKYEKIWIDNQDISVYEVKDGYVRSIIDKEGLIEAEAIDRVSDEIAKEADELLELVYGEENSSKRE